MRLLTVVVAAIVLLPFGPAEAQEPSVTPTKLFIAAIADRNLDEGPTVYEYIERMMEAPECSTVVPVGKEGIADFTVWFEFKDTFRGGSHHMTLWDASGHWVAGDRAGKSAEIVAVVCNTIAPQPTE